MQKQRLVIIGNGMAGARLVEEVVARGGRERYEIIVFGEEPYGNYNRILLSGVLAGSNDPTNIFLNALSWYHENGIQLHAGTRVQRIDPAAKCVYAADGTVVAYDKLVLATGSSPVVPDLQNLSTEQGSWLPGVFVFRTMDDCNAILQYAREARSVAVIGAGLLGLEAARGLLNHEIDVHVVHASKHVMNVQLDAASSKMVRVALERMGVTLHLEKRSSAVLGEQKVQGLAFEDGSTLDCDMVVISTGVRPNVDLARDAGLSIERGVLVQDRFVV